LTVKIKVTFYDPKIHIAQGQLRNVPIDLGREVVARPHSEGEATVQWKNYLKFIRTYAKHIQLGLISVTMTDT